MWFTLFHSNMPRQFPSITIGAIYHPHPIGYTYDKPLTDHICHAVDHVNQRYPQTGFVITGDFNQYKDVYIKRCLSLKQTINTPTRQTATLDQFFTNMHTLYERFQVLGGLGRSDHNIIIVFPHKSDRCVLPKTYTINVCSCNHNQKAMFSYDLRNVKWENLYQLQYCAETFVLFDHVISSLIEEHFPWKLVKRNTNDKPWVTDHFRDLCIIRKHTANQSGDIRSYNLLRKKKSYV